MNSSSGSCTPLVNESDLSDGGIPTIIGINIAIGIVIVCVFFAIHCLCKDFAMTFVHQRERTSVLLSGDDVDFNINEKNRMSGYIKGLCKGIINFLKMSEKVQKRIGRQGRIYLTLQLYFIAILIVYTFFSLVVILPINMSGDTNNLPFASTTLANVNSQSPLLWAHAVFSVLYFVIAAIFFLHFLLVHEDTCQTAQSAVIITGIPKYVHVEDLLQHFEEAVPDLHINDIKFAFNVKDLKKQWKKFKKISEKIKVSIAFEEENGLPLLIRPTCCSQLRVNAKEYHTERLEALQSRILMERNNALNSKLSTGFITFHEETSARKLVQMYGLCNHNGPVSSLSDSISSKYWGVSIAPNPSDIIWSNLSVSGLLWWLKWLVLNIALALFLVFFTTPAVLLNSIPQISLLETNGTHISAPNYLRSYWSSFLLIVFGFLLLLLVTKSVYLESYWSRFVYTVVHYLHVHIKFCQTCIHSTEREFVVLRKTFVYKALQAIILPSIGLTSLSAVASVVKRAHLKDHLSCIFLPNNGAFFISYVIIATFVSTPLELLRLPQLLTYVYGRLNAKTKFERKQLVNKILRENFPLGVQYSYCLLLFTLTVTFSTSIPLIVPFGVLFFIIKYIVDKYNLIYAYRRLPQDDNVHIYKVCIKVALSGVCLLQLLTFAYCLIRSGKFTALSITMLICFMLCIIMMCGIFIYGWFGYFMPSFRQLIHLKSRLSDIDENNKTGLVYIAPVLTETAEIDTRESFSLGSQTYESFGRTIAGGNVNIEPSHT